MTPVTLESWASLLVQIPVVAIFVWFTLEINKRNTTSMEAIAKCTSDATEKRDAEWREFLKDQREQNNAALGRLAEELKANSRQVAVLQSLVVEHSSQLNEIMPRLKEVLYTKE